jgi:hypothetical protein
VVVIKGVPRLPPLPPESVGQGADAPVAGLMHESEPLLDATSHTVVRLSVATLPLDCAKAGAASANMPANARTPVSFLIAISPL